MPSTTQARLEFRLHIAFQQLVHAQQLAQEYGDAGMVEDLGEMAQHVQAMNQDLLARTRRRKPQAARSRYSANK